MRINRPKQSRVVERQIKHNDQCDHDDDHQLAHHIFPRSGVAQLQLQRQNPTFCLPEMLQGVPRVQCIGIHRRSRHSAHQTEGTLAGSMMLANGCEFRLALRSPLFGSKSQTSAPRNGYVRSGPVSGRLGGARYAVVQTTVQIRSRLGRKRKL